MPAPPPAASSAAKPADLIDAIWDITVGHEGDKLDLTAADPGNWTGGAVGVGQLKGSKFGISAKRYPNLNIAGLTYAAAKAIFVADFWVAQGCERLPPAMGLLVVDAAYNGGHPVRWLQAAVGAAVDGDFGTLTATATNAAMAKDAPGTLARYQAQRLAYLTNLPSWQTFGAHSGIPLGWSQRLFLVLAQALTLGTAPKFKTAS